MLLLLRGRAHEVHSGVAVARGKELAIRHAVTTVRMRAFGEEELEAYVGLGEGVGKAGGYAIQGRAAAFVEWIGGDYTNVVGLPDTGRDTQDPHLAQATITQLNSKLASCLLPDRAFYALLLRDFKGWQHPGTCSPCNALTSGVGPLAHERGPDREEEPSWT